MPNEIAIICHAERLWPHDAGNKLCFGLNVLASFTGSDTVSVDGWRSLHPWAWQPIRQVYLWPQGGGARLGPYPVRDFPTIPFAVNHAAVADALKARSAALANLAQPLAGGTPVPNPAPFLWDPARPIGTEDDNAPLWRHLLGTAATYPAPLPQRLNLAFCFDVPAADLGAATAVLVAPEVIMPGDQVTDPPPNLQYTPAPAAPPAVDAQPAVFRWANGQAGAAAAYTAACDLTPPPDYTQGATQPRYLDLRTGWILPEPGQLPNAGGADMPALREDWAVKLEGRMADAWDLPALLLAAARAGKLGTPWKQWVPFREAILCTLGDRAGTGWRDGADGAGLLAYALRLAFARSPLPGITDADAQRRLQNAVVLALQARARLAEQGLDQAAWVARLAGVLGQSASTVRCIFRWPGTGPVPTAPIQYTLFCAPDLTDAGLQLAARQASNPAKDVVSFELLLPPAGWYFARATGANSVVLDSDRQQFGPTPADDLAQLDRLAMTLRQDAPLRTLVAGLWDEAFAPFAAGAVAVGGSRGFLFRDYVVPADPALPDVEVGSLDLGTGDDWALTVPTLAYAAAGTNVFRLELRQGPSDTPTTVALEVTELLAANKRTLKFQLLKPTMGAYPLTWPVLELTADPYDLRLLVRRTGAGEFEFNLACRNVSSSQWQQVAPAPAAMDIQELLHQVDVGIVNVAGSPLKCGLPTAVATRTDAEVAAWDALATLAGHGLDAAAAFWDAAGAQVKEVALPLTETARRLALGNVGRVWPALIRYNTRPGEPADEQERIRARFVKRLRAAFTERLDLSPGAKAASAFRDYQPMPADRLTEPPVITAVGQFIEDQARAFALTLVPPPPAPGDGTPVETAESLQFQVDRLGNYAEGDDDLLRALAGVGLLLRQANPPGADTAFGAWRCPNLSRLTTQSEALLIHPEALAPARVSYRNGARQGFLSYDSRPLVARSPLAAFARIKGQALEPATPAPPGTLPNPDPILSFVEPIDHPDPQDPDKVQIPDWALLPALKFGQRYEALPFLVRTSGALPVELADSHPAALRKWGDFNALYPNMTIAQRYVRGVRYLRLVRVGRPRLAPDSDASLQVPTDAAPLQRELELRVVSPLQKRAVFFRDAVTGNGLLDLTGAWTVTLPRLSRPGVRFDGPQQLKVLLNLGDVRLQVERNGAQVAVKLLIGGADQGAPAPPLPQFPASAWLDVRLQRPGGSNRLEVAVRVADDDAAGAWQTAVWATPAAPAATPAWLIVETADPAPVTFATPVVQVAGNPVPVPLDEPPLVLLPPATDQQPLDGGLLRLRPPAVDLQTWDRWIAFDLWRGNNPPITVDQRRDVWADYHEHLPDDPDPKKANLYDLSLDDPAADSLVVELVPLLVDERTAAPETVTLTPQGGLTDLGLPHVRKRGVTITLKVAPRAAVPVPRLVQHGNDVCEVFVTEREIWELRVYAAVPAEYFDPADSQLGQRFAQKLAEDCPVAGGRRLCPPLRMALEVATQSVVLSPDPDHPDEAAEQQALYDAIFATFDGTQTQVRLEPMADQRRRFRYLGQADLLRQVWRWRGRPFSAFPFAQARNPDRDARDVFPTPPPAAPAPRADEPNLLLWDVEGFGDRSPLDLLVSGKSVTARDPSVTLFTESLAGDGRALYYRFAVRAYNRYGSAAPQKACFSLATRQPRGTTAEGTAWRRLLAPCRRTEAVPRPLVKLVLPLTQAESAGARTPGLLAVLAEPWFALGGLAEQLEVELAQVVYPDNDTTVPGNWPKLWPQFGPDPILRGQGWQVNTEPLRFAVLGLLGHTFDTNTDSPRYVAASAVIPAANVTPVAPDQSLGWYFAQVRFRRHLLAEGCDDYRPDAATALVNPGQTISLTLPPTDLAAGVGWTITLADLEAPAAGTAAVLTAHLTSNPNAGDALDAGLEVQFAADGKTEFRSLDPLVVESFPPGTRAEQFELRWVLRREDDADHRTPDKDMPWHVAVYYRVTRRQTPASERPPDTLAAWQVLATFPWVIKQSPQAATGKLELTWTGPAALRGRPALTLPARISRFTQGFWVQLLPDAAALRPPAADSNPTLRWLDADSFELRTSDSQPLPWPPPATPPAPGENVRNRFSVVLFLTEPITDVRGLPGQERFLGVAAPGSDASHFDMVQRAPDLSGDAWATVQQVRRVRLRMAELQARSDVPVVDLNDKLWDRLFGPVEVPDATRAADADARLVRVGEPIDFAVHKDGS